VPSSAIRAARSTGDPACFQASSSTFPDSGSDALRKRYAMGARDRRRAVETALDAALCPVVEIRTDRPYVPALVRYFKHRKRRGVA